MFDSLKEKIGSFRDDVEETAEEKAEPVDDEDGEELPETDPVPDEEADGVDATGDSETDSGLDAEPGFETDPETAPGSEPEVRPESPERTPEREPQPDSDPSPESAPAPSPGEPGPTPAVETEPDGAAESAGDTAEAGSAVDEPTEGAGPSVDPDVAGETEPEGIGDVEDEPDADPSEDAEPIGDDGEEPVAEAADVDDVGEEGDESIGFGRKARSLVRGKFVIEEEDIEEPLEDLELALLSSDVEMGVTEEIIENIREELVGETRRFRESTGEVVEDALREAIHDVISVGQFDFEERVADADKPLVIVFTGVNGVGKTTTIAKMSQYLEERGFSSVLANGDTYRAGANEQIQEHADALDRRLIAHDQGGDPAAVLYDAVEYAEANGVDVVLGDTAGRLHTDQDLMAQLEKIDRVVGPDMALFVDEAVAGQDAVNRAREFDAAAPFDGAVLTKADADSNGGAAISIAHVTGNPVLFLGTGQGYDDIERFDPDRMIDRLLDDAE